MKLIATNIGDELEELSRLEKIAWLLHNEPTEEDEGGILLLAEGSFNNLDIHQLQQLSSQNNYTIVGTKNNLESSNFDVTGYIIYPSRWDPVIIKNCRPLPDIVNGQDVSDKYYDLSPIPGKYIPGLIYFKDIGNVYNAEFFRSKHHQPSLILISGGINFGMCYSSAMADNKWNLGSIAMLTMNPDWMHLINEYNPVERPIESPEEYDLRLPEEALFTPIVAKTSWLVRNQKDNRLHGESKAFPEQLRYTRPELNDKTDDYFVLDIPLKDMTNH